MIGTARCVYETPCGWYSKWDKECDEKIMRFVRAEIEGSPVAAVATCQTEEDHIWEPCGISNMGLHYICRKCLARKVDDGSTEYYDERKGEIVTKNTNGVCKSGEGHHWTVLSFGDGGKIMHICTKCGELKAVW